MSVAGFQYSLIYWKQVWQWIWLTGCSLSFPGLTLSKSSTNSTINHSLILKKIFTEHLICALPHPRAKCWVKWCRSYPDGVCSLLSKQIFTTYETIWKKQNAVWHKEQSNIKGQILIVLISSQRVRNKSSSPTKSFWPGTVLGTHSSLQWKLAGFNKTVEDSGCHGDYGKSLPFPITATSSLFL